MLTEQTQREHAYMHEKTHASQWVMVGVFHGLVRIDIFPMSTAMGNLSSVIIISGFFVFGSTVTINIYKSLSCANQVKMKSVVQVDLGEGE